VYKSLDTNRLKQHPTKPYLGDGEMDYKQEQNTTNLVSKHDV